MRKIPLGLLFCVFFLWSILLGARNVEAGPLLLLEHADIYCEENLTLGVLTIEDLHSNDFRPAPGGKIACREFEKALWVRIPMEELKALVESSQYRKPVLVLRSEYISLVDFFMPTEEDDFVRWSHGLNTPADSRSFSTRFAAFLVDQIDKSNVGGYAYLHIRLKLPTVFDIGIQDEYSFYSGFLERLTQFMVFYGFLAALMLAYLFFYLMTADNSYILSVLRLFGAFVFLWAFNGYLQFYFDISPYTALVLGWAGLSLHCVMAAFFNKYLLRTDKIRASHIFLHRLILVHVALGLIMLAAAFSGLVELMVGIVLVALIFDMVGTVAVTVIKLRERDRTILFFTASRFSFFLGLVLLGFDAFTYQATFFGENLSMAAFLLDPILLACMLVLRARFRLENYGFMEEKTTHYEIMTQKDGMTGLYNKAHLMVLLSDNIRMAHSAGRAMAFMMIDIDFFKKFNDTWGHLEGDKVLTFLAKVIRQSLRESDLAARYGGEEFSVILPGGTLPTSVLVAERIRKTCETQSKSLGEGKEITVSLGLAFLRSDDTPETLIQRADEALYRAKSNGRNRTEFEVEP